MELGAVQAAKITHDLKKKYFQIENLQSFRCNLRLKLDTSRHWFTILNLPQMCKTGAGVDSFWEKQTTGEACILLYSFTFFFTCLEIADFKKYGGKSLKGKGLQKFFGKAVLRKAPILPVEKSPSEAMWIWKSCAATGTLKAAVQIGRATVG